MFSSKKHDVSYGLLPLKMKHQAILQWSDGGDAASMSRALETLERHFREALGARRWVR